MKGGSKKMFNKCGGKESIVIGQLVILAIQIQISI